MVAVPKLVGEAPSCGDLPTAYLIEVSPAVAADGTAVIGSNDAFEYAVNGDGNAAVEVPKGRRDLRSPAVSRGRAMFGAHKGRVHTIDLATGKVLAAAFGEQTPSRSRSVGVWTSPAIDRDGNVYVGTRLGHIEGFDRAGALLFDVDTKDTVDSYPALSADGTLLIGSSNGLLYAIRD